MRPIRLEMDGFASFRTNLDTLMVNKNLAADLSPAFLIYQRYQERFQQHIAYVNELLDQDKFKFNTDEKIQLDRRHAPYPKDMKGEIGADELARQALATGAGPEAILQACNDGMQRIGAKFGRGEAFVPELLMAAKAMNAVMAHLKPFFLAGTVKSSLGIGLLLTQGIGDTIRVSLTEDPVMQVRAA